MTSTAKAAAILVAIAPNMYEPRLLAFIAFNFLNKFAGSTLFAIFCPFLLARASSAIIGVSAANVSFPQFSLKKESLSVHNHAVRAKKAAGLDNILTLYNLFFQSAAV